MKNLALKNLEKRPNFDFFKVFQGFGLKLDLALSCQLDLIVN